MKKRKIFLLIISLLLIVVPFFINIYSVFKLISLLIGIVSLNIFFSLKQNANIFLLICIPIILITLTYTIDYLKTYLFKTSPIYILENKINEYVSIYNSLFYRIYKCDNKYIFDNNYEKNFVCETKLLDEISINKLLNEPLESYKEHKNDFIKVTGKVSKITGTSSIELQAYTLVDGSVNGYVKFNNTSKLTIKVEGIDISNYRIYDYITVVGLLNNYDKDSQELTLINSKIEDKNVYSKYTFNVIESSKCSKILKEYTDNYYTYCLENIYLDYGVDKYELSYALKDKKINFEKIVENSEIKENKNKTIYELEKFNILVCSENKNILVNRNEKMDYSWCEE